MAKSDHSRRRTETDLRLEARATGHRAPWAPVVHPFWSLFQFSLRQFVAVFMRFCLIWPLPGMSRLAARRASFPSPHLGRAIRSALTLNARLHTGLRPTKSSKTETWGGFMGEANDGVWKAIRRRTADFFYLRVQILQTSRCSMMPMPMPMPTLKT